FNAGQSIAISAVAATGYKFVGWTGTGSGSFTGASTNGSVTMNGPIMEAAFFEIPPQPDTVVPNSGSGASQPFRFAFIGGANIRSAQIDIGPTLSTAHSCFFYFVAGAFSVDTSSIYLEDDQGSSHAPLTLGSPGTAQNSQCKIDAGASSVDIEGNAL